MWFFSVKAETPDPPLKTTKGSYLRCSLSPLHLKGGKKPLLHSTSLCHLPASIRPHPSPDEQKRQTIVELFISASPCACCHAVTRVHLSAHTPEWRLPLIRLPDLGHLNDARAALFLAALSVCVCCGLPGLILELALMLHTVASFATQWQWVKLWSSLCFFSTRGPWCRHCRHYYLHPAAGHLGECTLLPLQKGQDLWPIWQTRPVSKTRDMTWDMS